MTRDELIELVLKLNETVRLQERQIHGRAQRIAELEAIVARQAERIAYLEEQLSKHGGDSKPHWIKASSPMPGSHFLRTGWSVMLWTSVPSAVGSLVMGG